MAPSTTAAPSTSPCPASVPVTICNSNLVTDGNFAAANIFDNTDPNWLLTPASVNSNFGYNPANFGGTFPPIGPQTAVNANAASFLAPGTEDDTITAAAAIPTVVGQTYILNFDLSFSGGGPSTDLDFNPSVGTPLTLIYPCGVSMPCNGTACSATPANYIFYSLSFIATSTSTPLSFGARNLPSSTYLTNVAVCSSVDSTTTNT